MTAAKTAPLRLGSRRSPMAIAQSGDVARLITKRTGRAVEIVGISSFGDPAEHHRYPPQELDVWASREMIVVREHGEAGAAGLRAPRLRPGRADAVAWRGAAHERTRQRRCHDQQGRCA